MRRLLVRKREILLRPLMHFVSLLTCDSVVCQNWRQIRVLIPKFPHIPALCKFSADDHGTAKAKPQYVQRTSGGGKWTVGMLVISFILVISEASRWWRGHEHH